MRLAVASSPALIAALARPVRPLAPQIRFSLRGQDAAVLMGKNTTIRKVIKDFLKTNPGHPIESLLPLISLNVGLIFTCVRASGARGWWQAAADRAPSHAPRCSILLLLSPRSAATRT